ncbi:Abi family protein [Idiomarina sp. HP20-50]|uniref:Abi family protein n=1 Tax=Idiomarina sp. HP20-50 TaxID=3070813 RepID=UPI00294B8B27|nr:Abi family protein [Idiomarina sp. HP20-50]MDV6316249.1 Abi family protein [Idiomarina sp. HP20-50]
MPLSAVKPFMDYEELIKLLDSRGMTVEDTTRAVRKVSQVGYYRLSGFWYPCRVIERDEDGQVVKVNGKPKRKSQFLPNSSFNNTFLLYKFDKRLRLLLLDAIERIEIHLRTIIAHELGRQDPLAYQKQKFINPSELKNYYKGGRVRNSWIEWSTRQQSELSRSKEDCILWHTRNEKNLPIWVAVEAWSFGTVSKYFELLKGSYQNKVAAKLGVSNSSLLVRWLQDLNTLRNRCAHHTRVWNQSQNNPIRIPTEQGKADTEYFTSLNLDNKHKKKIYGLITIIWYLVRNIGPNSDWIQHVLEEIESIPDLPFDVMGAMGIPANGLSIDLFID